MRPDTVKVLGELNDADLDAIAVLVGEHGSLAAAVDALRTGGRRRRAVVPFRDAGQVLDAVANRVITRDEARRLLGHRVARRRS